MSDSTSKKKKTLSETKLGEDLKIICKGCGKKMSLILSHLERTKACQSSYDMNAMRQKAELLKKERKAQRSRDMYESNPEKKRKSMRDYNSKHREEINKSMSNLYCESTSEQVHECPHCDMEYRKIQDMKRHIRHAHSQKNYTFSCQICDKSIMFKSNLERHMKEVHGCEKYKCEKCPATYTRKYELENHISNGWHFFEYQCNFCNQTLIFKNMSSLIDHTIIEEPGTEHRKEDKEPQELEDNTNSRPKTTSFLVTCKAYQRDEKVELSREMRSNFLLARQYKEKVINAGLSRVKTRVKFLLEKEKHEVEDRNGNDNQICKWCEVESPSKDEFCDARETGTWTLDNS